MNHSQVLDTIRSLSSGPLPQLEQLRRQLVPLLVDLPLPHSRAVSDLHAAIDKTIRAAQVVEAQLPMWEHLVAGPRSRA